jgi:maltokinase
VAKDEEKGLAGLEARVRGAVADLPLAAIAGARWSGLGAQVLRSVEVLDAFGFVDGGILAILEARPAAGGEPVHLTLPLLDASPWPGLHGLASRGGSVAGFRGGRLVGRPGLGVTSGLPAGGAADGASHGASHSFRPSSGDQSHTSVVIDERAILKLYRRLTPGPNPEAEVLDALAMIPDAPVPTWCGAVDLVLGDGETTALAIEQALVAGAVDAFELVADGLAAWLKGETPPPPVAVAAASGVATGRLHVALARVDRSAFTPRSATREDQAVWLRRGEARVEEAVRAVGAVDQGLAAWVESAAPAIRRALRPLGDAALPVRLQRIHGDLHLGQVLPTPAGVLLVDFEGDPTRDPSERRAVADRLRDVAAFLRSIDHAARSGYRRAIQSASHTPDADEAAMLDGWIELARDAFLGGYSTGLGDPAWAPDRALLRALEVDKELGELVYAATFLPTWLYAPTGGLRALLGDVAGIEAPA